MNRHAEIKRDAEPPAELESQFILRLPPVCTVTNSIWSQIVHWDNIIS